jgi:hypothetical protein
MRTTKLLLWIAALLISNRIAFSQTNVFLDPSLNPNRLIIEYSGGLPIKVFFWFELVGNSPEQKTIKAEQLVPGGAVLLRTVTNCVKGSGAIVLAPFVKDSIFLSYPGTYSFTAYGTCPPAANGPGSSMQIDPTAPNQFRSGDVAHGAIINITATQIGGGDPGFGRGRPGHGGCCCCGMSNNIYPSDESEIPLPGKGGLYPQVGNNLCWAAVAQNVIDKMGNRFIPQCTLAGERFGLDPAFCPDVPSFFDVTSHGQRYLASSNLNEVEGRLESSHDELPWFVSWNDGGDPNIGHYMLIVGISHPPVIADGPNRMLKVFDPLPVGQGDMFLIPKSVVEAGQARFLNGHFYYHV